MESSNPVNLSDIYNGNPVNFSDIYTGNPANFSAGIQDIRNECGEDFLDHYLVKNYKYICDGVLVSIIGLIGFIGNITSLIVLSRPKLRDSFHQMLFALACFDIVYIIVGGFNYTFRGFDAGSVIYTIAFPYLIYPLTNISMCGTIFMTVAISIERFLGICFPLYLPPHNRKAWYYVLPVVFITFLLNIPKFLEGQLKWEDESMAIQQTEEAEMNHSLEMNEPMQNFTDEVPRWVPSYQPTELRKNSDYIRYYIMWGRMFTTALIPVLLLVFLNAKIIFDVYLSNVKVQRFGSKRRFLKELNFFFIMLVIVIVFILCHTPRIVVDTWEFSHLENINYCQEKLNRPFLPSVWIQCLMHVSHLLNIFNSSVNFVIYCFIGHGFRREFFRMIGLSKYTAVKNMYNSELSRRSSKQETLTTSINGNGVVRNINTQTSIAKDVEEKAKMLQIHL